MEMALAIAGIGSILCLLLAAVVAIIFAIFLRRAMRGIGTLALSLPAPPPPNAQARRRHDPASVRSGDTPRVTDPTPAGMMSRPPEVVAAIRSERRGRQARREETYARLTPLPTPRAPTTPELAATPATQEDATPRAHPRAGRSRTGPVGLEHIAFGSAPDSGKDAAATEVFDRRRPTAVPPDDDLTDGEIVPEED